MDLAGGLDLEGVPERRHDERLWTEMLNTVEATVADWLQAGDELEGTYTWLVDEVGEITLRLRKRGASARRSL